MTTHKLKIVPTYYHSVLMGKKSFEVRKDDRGYKLGDYLELQEWIPAAERYSGYSVLVEVTYVLRHEQMPEAIAPGYVVLGLGVI